MTQVHQFRMAMAKHLGKVVTPEVAAAIECEAFYEPDRSIDPARFEPHEYRGIVFAVESFRLIMDELQPLHEAHFAETERARKGLVLNPDLEYVCGAERRGDLLQVTARISGKLVGHARFYIYRDIHTQTPAAREDAYFIAPEVRKGFNAIRMWQYAERCLSQIGIIEVRTDSKILFDENGKVTRNVGRLNEFLGYKHIANQYLKRLTGQ